MIYFKKGIEWDYEGVNILNAVNEIINDGAKIYIDIQNLPITMNYSGWYGWPSRGLSRFLVIKNLYINDKRLCSTPCISYYNPNQVFQTQARSYQDLLMAEHFNQTNVNFDLFVCDTVGSECFILLCGNGNNGFNRNPGYSGTNFGLHISSAYINSNIICFNYNGKLCCHNNIPFTKNNCTTKNNNIYSQYGSLTRPICGIYNIPFGIYRDIETNAEDIYIEKLSFNTSPISSYKWYGYGETDNLYISPNLKRTAFGTVVKDDNNNKFIGCGLGAFYMSYSDDLLLPSTYSGEVGPYKENVNEEFLLKDGFLTYGDWVSTISPSHTQPEILYKYSFDEFNNDIIIGGKMGGAYATNNDTPSGVYKALEDFNNDLSIRTINTGYTFNNFYNLFFLASMDKNLLNINNYSFSYKESDVNKFIFDEPLEYTIKNKKWYYNYLQIGIYHGGQSDDINNQSGYHQSFAYDRPTFYGKGCITDTIKVNNTDLITAGKCMINYYYNLPYDDLLNNVNKLFNNIDTVRADLISGGSSNTSFGVGFSTLKNNSLFIRRYRSNSNNAGYSFDCIGSKIFDVTHINTINLTVNIKESETPDVHYKFYVYYNPASDTADHFSGCNHNVQGNDLTETGYYKWINSSSADREHVSLDVSELTGNKRLYVCTFLGWDGDSEEITGLKGNTCLEVKDIEFIYDEEVG